MALSLNINQREKYTILAGGAAVALLVIFQLVVFPVQETLERNKREIRRKTVEYAEMLDLKREYDEIIGESRSSLTGVSERDPEFTLFSFLDQLAGKVGVKDNISYMKPSIAVKGDNRITLALVEMKLQAVTMGQLLSYLHMVESSESMVYVRGIAITREGREQKFLSAVLQIETVKT